MNINKISEKSYAFQAANLYGLRHNFHSENEQKPPEPVVFVKPRSTLVGIQFQHQSIDLEQIYGTNLAYEIELGVVIGQSGKNIALESALTHIKGYCIIVDITRVPFENEGETIGTVFKTKVGDKFTPFGPMFTLNEPSESFDSIVIELNAKQGKLQGCTNELFFNPAEVISHISKFVSLDEWDIIMLGSPGTIKAVDNDHVQATVSIGKTVVSEISFLVNLI